MHVDRRRGRETVTVGSGQARQTTDCCLPAACVWCGGHTWMGERAREEGPRQGCCHRAGGREGGRGGACCMAHTHGTMARTRSNDGQTGRQTDC